MRIPHNAFVVVADGRKMLFLRNEGDAEFPNLQVEKKALHPNLSDHEQAADAAGQSQMMRSGASGWVTGGNVENTDFHQLEEDRFAAETAELLKARALANDFESLIVVAPPRTLGELRKHYHVSVREKLAGEIDKDLTAHSVAEIEQALLKAE